MENFVLSISDELEQIQLPDKRLKKRSSFILDKLYKSPDKSLPASFGGRNELKAAYRFFDQSCVTPDTILLPHVEKTIERINQYPTVLLVNDTTDINMSHMERVGDLGVLNNVDCPGCSFHTLVAFTIERLPLGTVSATFVKRLPEELGKHKHKESTPIEERESYRWLQDYRKACEIAKTSSSKIIYMADREACIHDLFHEAKMDNHSAELLIRGQCTGKNQKRVLQSNGKTEALASVLKKAESLGILQFHIPSITERKKKARRKRPQKGRDGRDVRQTIKSMEVTILPPRHKKHLSKVKVYALLLEETNPPTGEEPIDWLLLTTLEIKTKEDAEKIVSFYLCRWGIETFFHILKTGCKIEELQFTESSRLLPCLAMYLIVSWRIMYTMMLGRAMPGVSCSILFEEDEWECAYAMIKKKRPPLTPPTLEEMINMVATMGGYLGRKADGPPGPKVIWVGIQKLYFNAEGWSAHKALTMST